MVNFPNPQQFISAISQHLDKLHCPYAGAHFSAAFARDSSMHFLTCSVRFRASHTPARSAQDYGQVLLFEEWVRDQSEALARLAQLLSGKAMIDGRPVSGTFLQTNGDRQTYAAPKGWTGWRYVSRIHRDPSFGDYQVRQTGLFARGLRPYLSIPDAVSDWVSDTPSSNSVSVLDQGCVVTMLPDLRASIVSAEYVPGLVRVEIQLGVPAEQIELQMLFQNADKPFAIVPNVKQEMEVEVPSDASAVHIFLVHTTGECIAELLLGRLYSAFGRAEKQMSVRSEAVADLDGGENDTVEYKPFVKANDKKESEFVETTVAFANTHGGRIYVGVQNDGSPQGEAAVRAAFNGELEKALDAQYERLKTLVREKIKPVPEVVVKQLVVYDDPVILAEVGQGQQRPYATHDNKVYIRKGATNKLADPAEWPGLMAAGSY